MMITTRLALRTLSENRSRYLLGTVAVTAAVAFMVAGRLVADALSAQLRTAGADDAGTSGELFLMLAMFGVIVVVAAALVITNSFHTLVAARTREVALLRAVGLDRRQGVTSLAIEGLVVGGFGSLCGLVSGTAAAWAIIAPTMGEAPLSAPGFTAVGLALLVGVGVSLAAMVGPARRSTRVAPMEALRASETQSGESVSRKRLALGLCAFGAGLGLSMFPVVQSYIAVPAFVGGALVAFAGLALLAPSFVPRAARGLARLAGRGPIPRLAAANLVRVRRRTGNTAMAVTLGVTLFTGVNVVLASVLAEAATRGVDQENSWQVFLLAFGLTGLTLVVGLIGVVNTIGLSVREREREIALLRAVGMTAREAKRAITVEGTLIGIIGITVGTLFGVAGAAVLLSRLGGSIALNPPWTLLALVALGSLAVITTSTELIGGRACRCAPTLTGS